MRTFGRIAYVGPDPFIMGGHTIRENIMMGKKADEEKMAHVLALVQLEEDIGKMVNGVETVLSERGGNISSGQR